MLTRLSRIVVLAAALAVAANARAAMIVTLDSVTGTPGSYLWAYRSTLEPGSTFRGGIDYVTIFIPDDGGPVPFTDVSSPYEGVSLTYAEIPGSPTLRAFTAHHTGTFTATSAPLDLFVFGLASPLGTSVPGSFTAQTADDQGVTFVLTGSVPAPGVPAPEPSLLALLGLALLAAARRT